MWDVRAEAVHEAQPLQMRTRQLGLYSTVILFFVFTSVKFRPFATSAVFQVELRDVGEI